MTDALLTVTVVLLVIGVVLQVVLFFRKVQIDLSPLAQAFLDVEKAHERTERAVRDEIAKNREETSNAARQSRDELGSTLKGVGDSLIKQLGAQAQASNQELTAMRETVEERLNALAEASEKRTDEMRQDAASSAQKTREELANTLRRVEDGLNRQLGTLTQASDQKLSAMRETIEQRLGALAEGNTAKLDQIRQESTASSQKAREEVNKTITDFLTRQREQFGDVLERLRTLADSNDKRLTEVRATLEAKLKSMQEDNAKSLEQMRQTVDEKLQGTLERRLGESFKLVSDRLEAVYKGLGEMQTLATGVGDLKRVLTNVKTRGICGEVQLGRMLEEVLTPEQYDTNVSTKGGAERVEFAIKLPGRGDDKGEIVWLPIDAKFPVEDYQRLVEAQEAADAETAEAASKQLESRIKSCAKNICDKYVNPPKTTDFGILFLPTEGLFAEVVRRPGLAETIQRNFKVVIAGPTTLWSILNSLQMGFRTLAIQQRSSEVWKVLAAVRTEFGKYGEVMAKVQKKLQEASNTVDNVAVRSRAIQKKLRGVEELPVAEAQKVLMLEEGEVESRLASRIVAAKMEQKLLMLEVDEVGPDEDEAAK